MENMKIIIESDNTWMKLADLLVETGIVSDSIENQNACAGSVSSGTEVVRT